MQHTDAGGTVGLVAGPGVEVSIERPQVHRHLRDRLSPVHEHHRPAGVRSADDVGHRVDRPDDVRDVDKRDQLRTAFQEHVQRLEIERTILLDGHVLQLGLAVLAEDLPGDDVGVVLHLGQHHQIPGAHVGAPPRVGDEVYRRGGVGRENRLLRSRPQP
jgi:hypothetical protein